MFQFFLFILQFYREVGNSIADFTVQSENKENQLLNSEVANSIAYFIVKLQNKKIEIGMICRCYDPMKVVEPITATSGLSTGDPSDAFLPPLSLYSSLVDEMEPRRPW